MAKIETKPFTVLDEFYINYTIGFKNQVIEEHIMLCTQTKPRYMPEFLWRRILARVVMIVE